METKSPARPLANNEGSNRGRVKQLKKARNQPKKSLLDRKVRVETLSQLVTYTYVQRYFPSATTFTVSGTGASYTAANGTLAVSTAADSFYSCYFRLGDLPQVSSFTTLYDQYRIDRVRFLLIAQNNTSSTSVVSFLTPHFITPDFDDNSVLGTVGAILEYQSCKIVMPYKNGIIELIPRVAVLSGTGSVNLGPQWLDCNDTTVQHYGVKGAIPQQSTGQKFTVIVEIEFSLKTVR
jgi:hypothetical protein